LDLLAPPYQRNEPDAFNSDIGFDVGTSSLGSSARATKGQVLILTNPTKVIDLCGDWNSLGKPLPKAGVVLLQVKESWSSKQQREEIASSSSEDPLGSLELEES